MAIRTSDTIWEDSSNPSVNDDGTTGIQVGDEWRNTSSGDVFIAIGVSTGAAEWINVTETLKNAGTNVISFGADQDYQVNRNNVAYSKAASFPFGGTDTVGVINSIVLNCWKSGGNDPDFRIYDATNAAVIAEIIGVTSTSEANLQSMGTISNLPTGAAIFELQIRRGGPGGVGFCASIELEY